ncbi:MAG TPA: Xaa-Pro aminopeptidase [Fibrobacteraceae bacterium]|jgi:Xaa-Pro aminopeptidase|nr:M24 family metallopeptidase [Fibrobacter sp.]HPW94673.1 Xaa-Pro aminopeptidase [Fibrobacteraceae bacterium]
MEAIKQLLQDYSEVFISTFSEKTAGIYQKRRRELLSKLDSFCVFSGVAVEPGTEEVFASTWTRFIQDPSFLFLTGINQAGCFLLLDPLAKEESMREVLFIPLKDKDKEFWVGKRIGYSDDLSDLKTLTGFQSIQPSSSLWNTIERLSLRKETPSYAYAFFFPDYQLDHNARFALEMGTFLEKKQKTLRSVSEIHLELRMVLDRERISLVEKAQEASAEAFKSILSRLPLFKNERALGLALDYELQSRGDGDLAFPTIVASGKNACCLHYSKKDESLQEKDLVLLDFGIRIGTQHSDISRTIPVSGQFDPLQKLLYNIVLEAQLFHEKQVRPGVTLRELDQNVWDFIEKSLKNSFTDKGGTFELLYNKRPHGVSHFIGEQVHEGAPKSRSLDVVLKPGMMISNEPGLYGRFQMTLDGVHYDRLIGIRIEDDLLITENGCINMSIDIPKQVEELERLIANGSNFFNV